MKLTSEVRSLAQVAYRFADLLRRRRNEGAHPIPALDFEHHGENKEFCFGGAISAGIWLIRSYNGGEDIQAGVSVAPVRMW